MTPTAKFSTEFIGPEGLIYIGPVILADSRRAANAILEACVRGPNGERLVIPEPFVTKAPVLIDN